MITLYSFSFYLKFKILNYVFLNLHLISYLKSYKKINILIPHDLNA